MSFTAALALVRELEGGKVVDAGGPTNQGITQTTWQALGYKGSVLNATDEQIAQCYHRLWAGLQVFDTSIGANRSLFEMMPELVDALAFQFFINVPPSAFLISLQAALLTEPDGRLGPKTQIALRTSSKDELARGILCSQILHYVCHSSGRGLLDRVERARLWYEKELS